MTTGTSRISVLAGCAERFLRYVIEVNAARVCREHDEFLAGAQGSGQGFTMVRARLIKSGSRAKLSARGGERKSVSKSGATATRFANVTCRRHHPRVTPDTVDGGYLCQSTVFPPAITFPLPPPPSLFFLLLRFILFLWHLWLPSSHLRHHSIISLPFLYHHRLVLLCLHCHNPLFPLHLFFDQPIRLFSVVCNLHSFLLRAFPATGFLHPLSLNHLSPIIAPHPIGPLSPFFALTVLLPPLRNHLIPTPPSLHTPLSPPRSSHTHTSASIAGNTASVRRVTSSAWAHPRTRERASLFGTYAPSRQCTP